MSEERQGPPLRFRREIGWTFVLALVVQTAGAFLWAGAASARLSDATPSLKPFQMVVPPHFGALNILKSHRGTHYSTT